MEVMNERDSLDKEKLPVTWIRNSRRYLRLDYQWLMTILLTIFYLGQCGFVVTPRHIACFTGERVTFECRDHSNKSLVWSGYYPKDTQVQKIYMGEVLSEFASTHSVEVKNGHHYLKVTASKATAMRYTCIDSQTGLQSSAELIVLDNYPECSALITGHRITVVCKIKFTGNWIPEINCYQTSKAMKSVVNNSVTPCGSSSQSEQCLTSNLTIQVPKGDACRVRCTVTFNESNKPKLRNSAVNVPDCNWTWTSPILIFDEDVVLSMNQASFHNMTNAVSFFFCMALGCIYML